MCSFGSTGILTAFQRLVTLMSEWAQVEKPQRQTLSPTSPHMISHELPPELSQAPPVPQTYTHSKPIKHPLVNGPICCHRLPAKRCKMPQGHLKNHHKTTKDAQAPPMIHQKPSESLSGRMKEPPNSHPGTLKRAPTAQKASKIKMPKRQTAEKSPKHYTLDERLAPTFREG